MTVPVTGLPPTTRRGAQRHHQVVGPGLVTVMVAVAWVLLSDAVITDVPAATALIVNVAEAAPAATLTDAGTVATPGLLLDSVTVPAAGGR